MFDPHAQAVINDLPRLPGLDPADCRRVLSRAYLLIVDLRVGAESAIGPDPERQALVPELRRMADALESVAVFDANHGIEVAESAKAAAAFVAAEAIALLADLTPPATAEHDDPLGDMRVYAALESGLLYMIGGYDVNAVAAVSWIPDPPERGGEGVRAQRCRAGSRLATRVTALCRGAIPTAQAEPVFVATDSASANDVFEDTWRRLYSALSTALGWYFAWLAGEGGEGAQRALTAVRQVRESCAAGGTSAAGSRLAAPYADVAHLAALLGAAIRATRERSVFHAVPPPGDGNAGIVAAFPAYLRRRARGTSETKGRPFLWPSALEYVRECLPGPDRDAVVSMPTGSGKSFLAELAVAHALARGWVVYLAPTNALAHQIRRDLKTALAAFDDVEVTAFVGGEEYTALSEDAINVGTSVCVMTPEKCALALRLYPDAFEGCSLCVFDECHLLNDEGRGVVADVVLAQLFARAPEMRTLLMSAMVANPADLQGWLADVRGHGAHRSVVAWRPSRTARGFVFLDEAQFSAARTEADASLSPDAAKRSRSQKRPVAIAWLMGLSGPWTDGGPEDYRAARLPLMAEVSHKRTKQGGVQQSVDSWKNRTGSQLGGMLAASGIPTINFIMSSRHHAFGLARDADAVPGSLLTGTLPPLVEAQLAIADVELGVPSALHELMRKGVAVHTSAMLQVEQAAAERMFTSRGVKLMFATGTLAQGLNLPAAAVVVSGSKLGGIPVDDAAAGIVRASSLILNGFGRAGRPGFANQAVVVLVSDEALVAPVAPNLTGGSVLGRYPVLGEADASVHVHSPIERFIDNILITDDVGATALDLALTTMLSSTDADVEGAGAVLRRTYGGWVRRSTFGEAEAEAATRRISDIKREFLEQDGVPTWMATAAVKAGVEFFRALRMWQALVRRGLLEPEQFAANGIVEWLGVLLDVLGHMPVRRVAHYLDDKATTTPRTRLFVLAAGVDEDAEDDPNWTLPEGWSTAWRDLGDVVRLHMRGGAYVEISALLYGTPVANITGQRGDGGRGLPPVFKFIGEVVERALAIDAGLLLALIEGWLEADHPKASPPEALRVLPLCVRNGCDTHGALSWHRFGFRQRVCAHAFAAAFPLPAEATDDHSRASFVRDTRRAWLELEAADPPGLLDHARVVIKEGSSERS